MATWPAKQCFHTEGPGLEASQPPECIQRTAPQSGVGAGSREKAVGSTTNPSPELPLRGREVQATEQTRVCSGDWGGGTNRGVTGSIERLFSEASGSGVLAAGSEVFRAGSLSQSSPRREAGQIQPCPETRTSPLPGRAAQHNRLTLWAGPSVGHRAGV